MVSFSTQRILKKIGCFYKYFVLLSSTVCVKHETIVANIVSRKSYTRNLLVAFIFSNFQFYVQNCRFRALFVDLQSIRPKFKEVLPIRCSLTLELVIFWKWCFWHFHIKSLVPKRRKQHFSAHSTRLLTPEVKIEKKLLFTKI
jgi:hypothetical protein